MRILVTALAFGIGLSAFSTPSFAQQTLYGDSAIFGKNPISLINPSTGAEYQRFYGDPGGNGRGIVTVGNTIYYTVTDDPHIYEMDATTGVTTGSILTHNQSMSTIAWDGTDFWTADYSGTNHAFRIDPVTGNNVADITLGNASGYMDGLEYFNGMLIGNRCDACGIYDIYDLSGNLLTDSFINTGTSSTGIAFDGTNFFVSNPYAGTIGVYSGTDGSLLNTLTLTPSGSDSYFAIEDLSVDYAQRADTGGGAVPEPSTWAMMLLGFAGIGAAVRRHKGRRLAIA